MSGHQHLSQTNQPFFWKLQQPKKNTPLSLHKTHDCPRNEIARKFIQLSSFVRCSVRIVCNKMRAVRGNRARFSYASFGYLVKIGPWANKMPIYFLTRGGGVLVTGWPPNLSEALRVFRFDA